MRRLISVTAASAALWVGNALADESRTIVQDGRAFHPAEITIGHGEALTFSNRDQFIHQIYVDTSPPLYDSDEQPPGLDIKVAFPSAGTFAVHCHIHPRMLLIVHVK